MNATPEAISDAQERDRRTYRVAFVNTHPIQYFAPLYAFLTRHCGLDTTALYLSDFSLNGGEDPGFRRPVTWDIDLLDGYTVRFVGGKRASRRRIGGFFSMIAPQLWTEIGRGRYDAVIIHGHNLAAHLMALAACRWSGTPVFLRAETHLRLRRPRWKAALRTPLMRFLFRSFDGFLAIGQANAAYYRAMGVAPSRVFTVPYSVDNDRFIAAEKKAADTIAATRSRMGIHPSLPVLLFASKFDRRKRPHDLLSAFARLQSEGVAAQLVMVGTGALEEELKARVRDEGIEHVIFPGFVNQADLPAVYAASDIFVLPSENEPWGLVVNEAMCAGLPIVLSEEIGCAEDLVEDGSNGALYPAGGIDALVEALRPLLLDPAHRTALGKESLARIRQWNYVRCADGIRAAIEATRARRRRSDATPGTGLMDAHSRG